MNRAWIFSSLTKHRFFLTLGFQFLLLSLLQGKPSLQNEYNGSDFDYLPQLKNPLLKLQGSPDSSEFIRKFEIREVTKVIIVISGEAKNSNDWNDWATIINHSTGDTLPLPVPVNCKYAGGSLANKWHIGYYDLQPGNWAVSWYSNQTHHPGNFSGGAPYQESFYGVTIFPFYPNKLIWNRFFDPNGKHLKTPPDFSLMTESQLDHSLIPGLTLSIKTVAEALGYLFILGSNGDLYISDGKLILPFPTSQRKLPVLEIQSDKESDSIIGVDSEGLFILEFDGNHFRTVKTDW